MEQGKSDGLPLPRLHYKNQRLTRQELVGCWQTANMRNWGLWPDNQWGTKYCQQACEWTAGRSSSRIFRWDQPWWTCQMQLCKRPWARGPSKRHPDSWPRELWNNVCCFKSLTFGVMCYVVLWLELCPAQNSYVEVLTPSTSECDLIWRHDLYRSNQVKLSSSGWALIQYD